MLHFLTLPPAAMAQYGRTKRPKDRHRANRALRLAASTGKRSEKTMHDDRAKKGNTDGKVPFFARKRSVF